MIFKRERSGLIRNFTMGVDPGYIYIEKIRGGLSCYMMGSKDFLSDIDFKLKLENGNLVSLNGQTISFRLSIEEV